MPRKFFTTSRNPLNTIKTNVHGLNLRSLIRAPEVERLMLGSGDGNCVGRSGGGEVGENCDGLLGVVTNLSPIC